MFSPRESLLPSGCSCPPRQERKGKEFARIAVCSLCFGRRVLHSRIGVAFRCCPYTCSVSKKGGDEFAANWSSFHSALRVVLPRESLLPSGCSCPVRRETKGRNLPRIAIRSILFCSSGFCLYSARNRKGGEFAVNCSRVAVDFRCSSASRKIGRKFAANFC